MWLWYGKKQSLIYDLIVYYPVLYSLQCICKFIFPSKFKRRSCFCLHVTVKEFTLLIIFSSISQQRNRDCWSYVVYLYQLHCVFIVMSVWNIHQNTDQNHQQYIFLPITRRHHGFRWVWTLYIIHPSVHFVARKRSFL